MMQFKGFKPQAMQRIAGNLGYQGDMSGFNDYLNQNPDKMSKMNMYQNKAMEMAKGGMVKKPNFASAAAASMGMTGAQPGLDISKLDFVQKAKSVLDASYSKDKNR